MSDAVNTGFILDMQRKLYRWSSATPSKVFADLFNIVCDRRTLETAWERLARNRGSKTPGTDGVTRETIQERPEGVAGFLDDIRQDLRSGEYRPQSVRQRLIPKPGKPGQFRPLGIPTLKDRLVQTALKMVLEAIFEADFYPTSYGFRPGRSTHDALERIRHRLDPTRSGPTLTRYVIEGDIKGCFDAIDHHVLMERVRRRIKDRKVLRLVLAFLKADIMIEGNRRHPVTGTPQGGVISPLLANIYLTAIDERYKRWVPGPREQAQTASYRHKEDRKRGRPTFYVVRYADDFVVLVQGTREDAERERDALAQFLKTELRMELSMEKTAITDVHESFGFLGYRVTARERSSASGHRCGKLFIPKDKLQYLRDRIKATVRKTPTGRTLSDVIEDLNPVIIGWRNYYRYAARASEEFATLDWWLDRRIMYWVRRKHDKASWADIRRTYPQYKSGARTRWQQGNKRIALFAEAKHQRYPDRGTRIPNGWNSPDEWFLKGADKFWEATNALATL